MLSDDRLIRTAGVPPASVDATYDQVIWRSRGYLPHIDAPDLVQHVVFRLADSLPAPVREDIARMPRSSRARAADAALDKGHGGRALAERRIAELVQSALLTFDAERYRMVAWCVMPNHVHALVQIGQENALDRIVHSWKSYTAKAANQRLRRSGAFWAPEYFDRFMRDEGHLARTAAYIEGNPVKVGLCDTASDWRFSSAWRGWAGGTRAVLKASAQAGGTPAVLKTSVRA